MVENKRLTVCENQWIDFSEGTVLITQTTEHGKPENTVTIRLKINDGSEDGHWVMMATNIASECEYHAAKLGAMLVENLTPRVNPIVGVFDFDGNALDEINLDAITPTGSENILPEIRKYMLE